MFAQLLEKGMKERPSVLLSDDSFELLLFLTNTTLMEMDQSRAAFHHLRRALVAVEIRRRTRTTHASARCAPRLPSALQDTLRSALQDRHGKPREASALCNGVVSAHRQALMSC